ncbi:MAG: zinc-binding dehydrogenase [Aigarchaeota archaeon]|nr:zinc-binding dehydrogenase [Aigarchaeota archaeon]MDW8092785.1 zinc-binding dehydrogenase [Nitrososphaerota archaeon]
MVSVKASVLSDTNGKFSLKEVEVPPLGERYIRVNVTTATTCGTDVHIWKGELPAPMPIILGHEAVGRVDEAPANSKDYLGKPLKHGDRVIWGFVDPCNRCYVCTIENLPSSCPNRRAYGITAGFNDYPHLNGAYAEAIMLGLNTPIFKLENDIDDEIVSPVSCALSSVIKGISVLNPRLIDRALVIGAGPLGIYACAYLSELGVSKIVSADLVDERLKMASQFGADFTINMKEHQSVESIKRELQRLLGDEGPTMVVEVAGDTRAVDLGIEVLSRGGRIATVGAVVKGEVRYDSLMFIRRQISLRGSLAYEPRHMLEGIRFIEQTVDKYPYRKLIGGTYTLADLERVLNEMREKRIIKGAIMVTR